MPRKKRVLVACGTAIATSTHVAIRLQRAFAERGLDIVITQGRVSEIPAYADDVDLVISTAPVAMSLNVPIVSGIPFLTGIGEKEALEEVLGALGGR